MSRRIRAGIAGLAVLGLGVAGCSSQPTTPAAPQTGDGTGGAIRVAETNTFFSFNPNHSRSNMDINSKVVGTTRANWQYIDNELNLVKDTSFGTFEKLSDEPLTVRYTVNDNIAWSDGNPVDEGDLLLQWAVMSGHFNGTGEGAVRFFEFAGTTTGLGLTALPSFEGERTMTLTYSRPYVDWEIAMSMANAQPAHVVAARAGLDEAALVELIRTATPGQADDRLAAVAKVWNEDFSHKSLPNDPALYLSKGPMIVSEMVADQSVTLKRNPNYVGNLRPKVDEITVRFIGDAAASIAALRNGEVDIIVPQPSTDTVAQTKALPNVTVHEGPRLSYDHLDLSFDSPTFADASVREAFLKTVPREQIVDRLIRPMYADAQVVNSQLYLPSEGADYGRSAEQNGSSGYAQVDIEGARQLLAGRTPTVRILYANDNPVRVDAFEMIRESATQAGFRIEDAGSADWGDQLGGGGYDAALFGWISSGVGNAGIPQIFRTQGGGNYNDYSNPEVDRLTDELMVETSSERVEELKRRIDAQLWQDGYGVTLFQGPGLTAHRDTVGGVKHMPNQTGVWWNFWEWTVND